MGYDVRGDDKLWSLRETFSQQTDPILIEQVFLSMFSEQSWLPARLLFVLLWYCGALVRGYFYGTSKHSQVDNHSLESLEFSQKLRTSAIVLVCGRAALSSSITFFPQRFQVLFIVRRHRDFYAFENWYRHKNFKWLLSKIHCKPDSVSWSLLCTCTVHWAYGLCCCCSSMYILHLDNEHRSIGQWSVHNGHITILLCCRPESIVFSSGSLYCLPPQVLS